MALRETKFALLTQKRLIWGVLRTLGDFSLAHAINQLRWASFVSPERCTAAAQQRSHRHGGQRTLGRPRTHKFRMQFTQCRNQHTPKNRRISTIRLQDLKYSPGNCMRNCKAPHAWRAPEGPTAVPVDGSGAWPGFETTRRSARQEPLVWRAPEGLAAVPVGGGGAWPGFETTRRAELAARTASGRAAAHGRTKQPGPEQQRKGHCTRYGAQHPIRRGALPTDRVQHTQSQEQTRNL